MGYNMRYNLENLLLTFYKIKFSKNILKLKRLWYLKKICKNIDIKKRKK